MADYSHTGGSAFTNEDKLPNSVKNNTVTATSVKTLDTGHDETSLKAQMTSEMNALMNTNGSLLENLLGSLIGGAIEAVGKLLEGAVNLGSIVIGGVINVGSAIIGGAIDAVGGFFEWVGSSLLSLLPGTNPPVKPLPPVYSTIKTNLEGQIQPFVDSFDQATLNIDRLDQTFKELDQQLTAQLEGVQGDIDAAQQLLDQIGDVNQKIADAAGDVLAVADAAREKADQVNDDLILYKTVNDQLVQDARDDAAQALSNYNDLSIDLAVVESEAADALAKLRGETESVLGNRIANAMTGSVSEYAVSTSETVPPTSGWVTSPPVLESGEFLWVRTTITFGSGSTSVTDPVVMAGSNGMAGADGVSFAGITTYYKTVPRGGAAPAKPNEETPTGWSETEPEYVPETDLYRTDKVSYSNNTYAYTAVSKVGGYASVATLAAELEARTGADSDMSKDIEALQNLQVGGRNLVLDSARALTSTEYLLGIYTMAETWEKGATYTASIKGQFLDAEGNRPGIWAAGTATKVASLEKNPTTGIYQATFVVPTGLVEQRPLEMRIYDVRPNTDASYGSSIEWVKIERGNKATDWSPAPEDMATAADYSTINTRLWGSQGELNKLNSALWDAQGNLNSANEIFKNDTVGWLKTAQEAMDASEQVNDAQTGLIATNNRAITAHQRIINLLYPNMTLVPMLEDGITPAWTTQCEKTADGGWIIPLDVPNGTFGVSLDQSTPHVSVDTSLTYRAVIKFRHHHPDPTAATLVQVLFAKSSSPGSQYLVTPVTDTSFPPGAQRQPITGVASGVIPAGQWTTWMGDFKFSHTFTEQIRVAAVTGHTYKDAADVQAIEVASLEIYPLIPSQTDVNAAHSEAIQANTKAIRLAFPDLNLDPQTTSGRPQWSKASTVTTSTTAILGLSPTYRVLGWTGASAGFIDFEPDISEYRIRGKILPGPSATHLGIYFQNEAGQDVMEAWRKTFPTATNQQELYDSTINWSGYADTGAWISNTSEQPLGDPSAWEPIDIVVKLKPGTTKARIGLLTGTATNEWVRIHDLRVTTFSPSQWQQDFTQNRAIQGLKDAQVTSQAMSTVLSGITTELKAQNQALMDMQKAQSEMIMRSMVMNLNSATSSYLDADGVFFRVYNNDNNIDIEALGTWVGKAIFTLVFGTSHETAMVEFSVPDGQSRRAVRSTQSRSNRKMARLDWWVYAQDQIVRKETATNQYPAPLGWSTLSEFTFPVEKTASHIIEFGVDWINTTRSEKVYGIRIVQNGVTPLKVLTQKNIGPTWPWEDGRRNQTILWSGNLSQGNTITFQVYTGSEGSSMPSDSQRTIGNRERTISWMQDKA